MEKDNKDKIKIIYIVGLGHSGSTLLDRIISTSPKVFSVGELVNLKKYIEKYDPQKPDKKNFCDISGKELHESYFWGPILKEIEKKNYKVFGKFGRLSANYVFRFLFFKKSLCLKFDEDKILRIILNRARETKGVRVKYILDSSKSLNRLAYLYSVADLDIYVIHLVRDVRGQINSWEKKSHDKNWLIMFYRWLRRHITIILTLKLKFPKEKCLRVGYDAFTKNPSEIIHKINDKFNLDIDVENYLDLVNKEKDFTFAGNGMRRRELKEIKRDNKWQDNFTPGKKIVLSILAFIPNKFWIYGRK